MSRATLIGWIILCNELNLDWTQEFVSLGISYDISKFSNITELNIEGKIGEIQKLICLWNTRNLTPYGKIIIVKSLLISKVIHILFSLPSPSAEMLSTLEQLFRNFIWNKKKPKFRKEIMETLPNLGGLKMTDLKSFDQALKISWIKRLMNQEKGWAEFPMKHGLNEILRYGDQYPKQILGTITNKFWRDVVLSIIKFNDCTNWKKNFIPYMPLWHNTLINIEYRKDWECKGYHIVDDIISNNGIIYTENELKDRGLKINFLDYAKLKYSIKHLEIKTDLYNKRTGPRLPGILFYIGLTSKGCNKIYNRLMKYDGNIIKEVKDKWEERLNVDIRYETVEQAFMELPKCKESVYQKYLQFKLLHHRTAINEKLYTMKLSETNLCQI